MRLDAGLAGILLRRLSCSTHPNPALRVTKSSLTTRRAPKFVRRAVTPAKSKWKREVSQRVGVESARLSAGTWVTGIVPPLAAAAVKSALLPAAAAVTLLLATAAAAAIGAAPVAGERLNGLLRLLKAVRRLNGRREGCIRGKMEGEVGLAFRSLAFYTQEITIAWEFSPGRSGRLISA